MHQLIVIGVKKRSGLFVYLHTDYSRLGCRKAQDATAVPLQNIVGQWQPYTASLLPVSHAAS